MDKQTYLRSCLSDIIDALDCGQPLPHSIEVNGEFIYPHVALERARAMRDVDEVFN